MHHYGEEAVSIERIDTPPKGYEITLRNHVTGAQLIIRLPLEGVFEDPERSITESDAMYLGRELAHELQRLTGQKDVEAGF